MAPLYICKDYDPDVCDSVSCRHKIPHELDGGCTYGYPWCNVKGKELYCIEAKEAQEHFEKGLFEI